MSDCSYNVYFNVAGNNNNAFSASSSGAQVTTPIFLSNEQSVLLNNLTNDISSNSFKTTANQSKLTAHDTSLNSLKSNVDVLDASLSALKTQVNALHNLDFASLDLSFVTHGELDASYNILANQISSSTELVLSSLQNGSTNLEVNNLDISGVLTAKNGNNLDFSCHFIPSENAQFDLGSAEYKIRHLYLSNNSLKFGDNVTLGVKDGNINISGGNLDATLNNEGVSINKFISNFNKFLQIISENSNSLSNIAEKALELQTFAPLNNETIRLAVNEWIDNSGTAKEKYGSIQYWDTSEVTDMNQLFKDKTTFNDDISTWNTSKVTNMSHMFDSANLFNKPLNTWDVSNVTNMSHMFFDADNFNQDLYNWNVSNVTNMESLFESMEQFDKNISNWDTSKVTNMSRMFKYNNEFNQDISSWNVSNVTNMSEMFSNADSFDQSLNNWNTSKVTNMELMFARSKCAIPIADWSLNSLQNIEYFIINNYMSPRQYSDFLIDLSKNTTLPYNLTLNVTGKVRIDDASTNAAYSYLTTVKNMTFIDGGSYSVSDISYLDNSSNQKVYLLGNDDDQSVLTLQDFSINLLDIGGLSSNYNVDSSYEVILDISNINKIKITGTVDMFNNDDYLELYEESVDENNLVYSSKTNSNIVNYSNNNLSQLIIKVKSDDNDIKSGSGFHLIVTPNILNDANIQQAVDDWIADSAAAEQKYGHISNWNTSQVTDMSYLFAYKTSFNDDISKWNVSNVTNMSHMFIDAENFNQDLYNWNVSNVTNMESLFKNMKQFDKNISNWDTSKVTNMNRMFKYNNEFNQDISSWNVSNVTDMSEMFSNTDSFDQSLNNWNTSNVKYMDNMFVRSKCAIPIADWSLNSLQNIENFITNNYMSPRQYSDFLIDLSKNTSLPFNLNLNVTGKVRIDDASTNAAYNYLITNKNMYILDGGAYSVSDISYLDNSGNSDVYFLDNYNNNSIITINNNNNIYLLDSGGLSDPYENDVDLSYILDLSNITKVTITGKIDMEPEYDYFKIYKNSIDPANIIYDSSVNDNDISLVSYDDKLIFTITSDNTARGSGIFLNIKPSLLTDANIQQAVNDWIDNSGTAENTYGHISNWNTSQVTNMSNLFTNKTTFNDDITKWNVSNVTNMSLMFISAQNFNQDLSGWIVSNVTNMQEMFASSNFNGNITKWDTSKVENMYAMFGTNGGFNQDISGWNVINVTDMRYMFHNATAFNQNISKWDISNATSISFEDINMTGMFNGASTFDQDWTVESVESNIGLWRQKLDQLQPTSFYTNGEDYIAGAAAIDEAADPKINP